MRQILLLLIPFFILSGGDCLAQRYPILHYTTRDGLSQMQVMATFRDSRGYLWVGTKHGLSKFNGESFERYAPDFKTIWNEVYGFAEDSKGNLYIESGTMITRFDGRRFVGIRKRPGLYSNVCVDAHDRVFCCDKTTGELNTLAGDSLAVLKWPSLKNRKLHWITYDKATRALIGNVDSVGLMRMTPTRLFPLVDIKTDKNALWQRARTGQPVIHQELHASGEHFLAEFGRDGWQPFLRIRNGKCEVLRTVPFDWIFRFQNQTYLLEADSKRFVSVFPTVFSHNSLTNTEHGTWFGTEKGLVFAVQNGIRYFPDSEVPYAWSVVEDPQKRMWFLNYSHPIQRFDGDRIETVKGYADEMVRKQKAAKVANIIPNQDGWYYGALRDKHGSLWLPNANGVLRYDGRKFDFLVRASPSNASSIAFSLLEDPGRQVVLQGSERVVHIIENRPPFRTESLGEKEGMSIRPYVLCMALEKSGVYWFGGGGMLSRYDAARKEWKEYSRNNKKMAAQGIFDVTFDDRGTLWLATYTHGLTYLDARRDTVRSPDIPELREPANAVMQLDADHLLISSQSSLYVMDLKVWYASKKVVLKCFNHHNGFVGLEPGQHGLYKDSRGRVWVMAGAGLSVIDPKKIDLSLGQVRTYVTKLNGQRLLFAQFAKDSVFALPFGQEQVRLEFESVGDEKPFRSQYRYYVEGLMEDWTPWQEESVATLTHLPSSTYTIRIKSRTGGTEANNSQEARIRFSVRIWPWQSPYFQYYASSLLLLVIGGAGYLYRMNRQKQYRIEMQAAKMAEEARQQTEKIAQQAQMVKVLEVQTAQAQMNPHFIFNVLGTLQALVYHNETAKANDNIVKFGDLMRSYLSASLSLDGTRESLERGMITLDQEIKLLQMYIDFEQLQYRHQFEATIHVSPDLSPDFYRIPPLLIQPFVENAIKHGVLTNKTKKGRIWVRFWLEKDEVLVCHIEDDGIGREASRRLKEQSIQTHRSEGTNLVRKRVELLNQLNYTIEIQTTDRAEGGTSVVVKINDNLE